MNAEGRMAEFLRLSKAVEQSEQTLVQLSQEIGKLQSSEDQFSEEIEQQQRIQWELEQKLEHLADCKTRAEALKHVLAENERIQEELDAIDLAPGHHDHPVHLHPRLLRIIPGTGRPLILYPVLPEEFTPA